MRIFGVDFTSAPKKSKPITCSVGYLENSTLTIEAVQCWSTFDKFESFLVEPGPWVAAVDFPLGQPRRLVEALGWPCQWEDYASLVGKMTKPEFVTLIDNYRKQQPVGDKHHLRETDKLAGACSPMMLYGVPVGKMFFEGAPRLQRSGVSVLPCRPNDSGRIFIEGYPALVTRHLVGKTPYKNEKTANATHRENRCLIIENCQTPNNLRAYGISLNISQELQATLIEDSTGDSLDAILCAVQASAFELNRAEWNKKLAAIDSAEGWIVDPTYANEIV